MKKIIIGAAACLFLLCAIPSFAADGVTGKWSLTRTNDEGLVFKQSLVIKDGKFTFSVTNADKKPVLFAKGEIKMEKLKALNVIEFTKIEGGASEDEVSPVDDDRQCIYTVDADNLTIALDFDKDRGKDPRVEVYSRLKK